MTTVTLTLPEELAETARQMGLLEDATLTELLEREIQRRRKSALASFISMAESTSQAQGELDEDMVMRMVDDEIRASRDEAD